MEKSLIDSLVNKDSAASRSIWQKLLSFVGLGEPTVEQKISGLLQAALAKETTTGRGNERVATLRLADYVVKEVLKDGMDPETCRVWAYACGKVIGLLVSCAVRPSRQRRAIQQIADDSVRTSNTLSIGTEEDLSLPERGKAESKASPSSTVYSDSGRHGAIERERMSDKETTIKEQKRKMAEDLESQALLTQDPGGKAALNMMAQQLRTELGLDEKPTTH